MILDQIYASDYLHLAPNKPTFFSDDDDDLSEDEEALENAETRAARQLKYGIQPSERPSKNGNANGNGKGKGKLVESNTSAPSNLNGDNHREGVNDEGNDLASSALRIRQVCTRTCIRFLTRRELTLFLTRRLHLLRTAVTLVTNEPEYLDVVVRLARIECVVNCG